MSFCFAFFGPSFLMVRLTSDWTSVLAVALLFVSFDSAIVLFGSTNTWLVSVVSVPGNVGALMTTLIWREVGSGDASPLEPSIVASVQSMLGALNVQVKAPAPDALSVAETK